MRATILVLSLFLLFLQNAYSQVSDSNPTHTVDAKIDVLIYPNPVQDILYFDAEYPVEYIKLFNQKGEVVFQTIPEDNQIILTTLKSGFYLFCAYINGVKVKKGIIKKV